MCARKQNYDNYFIMCARKQHYDGNDNYFIMCARKHNYVCRLLVYNVYR